MKVFQKIRELLDKHKLSYEIKHHPPTRTSEDSAKFRNEQLKIGAKALLVKGKDEFVLCILPADRKLETKSLKKILNSKHLRFATVEELKEMTGLVPGGIPPFGGIFGIRMIVDSKLFEEEWMAFNAGSLEASIKMRTTDYKVLVDPETAEFSVNL